MDEGERFVATDPTMVEEDNEIKDKQEQEEQGQEEEQAEAKKSDWEEYEAKLEEQRKAQEAQEQAEEEARQQDDEDAKAKKEEDIKEQLKDRTSQAEKEREAKKKEEEKRKAEAERQKAEQDKERERTAEKKAQQDDEDAGEERKKEATKLTEGQNLDKEILQVVDEIKNKGPVSENDLNIIRELVISARNGDIETKRHVKDYLTYLKDDPEGVRQLTERRVKESQIPMSISEEEKHNLNKLGENVYKSERAKRMLLGDYNGATPEEIKRQAEIGALVLMQDTLHYYRVMEQRANRKKREKSRQYGDNKGQRRENTQGQKENNVRIEYKK